MSDLPPPPPSQAVPDVETAWQSVTSVTERLEATMLRATSFTEDERQQRVDDEWSTVESLRHLVLVIDLWLSRSILGDEDPFHPMALPPTFMPAKLPGSSIDPEARPTYAEACGVLRGRLAALRGYVDTLTSEDLERPIESHARTVAGGLGVIFNELTAHDRFINRDLDVIEGSRA